jgi:hypothetical protein
MPNLDITASRIKANFSAKYSYKRYIGNEGLGILKPSKLARVTAEFWHYTKRVSLGLGIGFVSKEVSARMTGPH